MSRTFLALLLGFCIDALLGDPMWLPHPICLIGNWIGFLERKLRVLFPKTPTGELFGGGVLVLLVTVFSGGIPFLLLWMAESISPAFEFGLQVIMFWQILAARCLYEESMKVKTALEEKSLDEAQAQLAMIVGRDTRVLDKQGVIKAAVETVAENTTDGVIAPMLYCMLGGSALGFLYKSINTMDSMVGYKNQRYLYFGRLAAKLDDVMNYLPARFSAVLMIGAAMTGGLDSKNAFRIWRRDRRNHASPNSAQTEAVCAGALGIQLAGNASYGGVIVEKPYIGDKTRPIDTEDILLANQLMRGTALLTLIFVGLIAYFLK